MLSSGFRMHFTIVLVLGLGPGAKGIARPWNEESRANLNTGLPA